MVAIYSVILLESYLVICWHYTLFFVGITPCYFLELQLFLVICWHHTVLCVGTISCFFGYRYTLLFVDTILSFLLVSYFVICLHNTMLFVGVNASVNFSLRFLYIFCYIIVKRYVLIEAFASM